ncbi:penicillin-binding protein activator [Haliangium sp.]|uniref:penicillin-binding protein activator n=1 Tax=Haliangium sp. TaxID=2663208 RepID=UPI003D137C07
MLTAFPLRGGRSAALVILCLMALALAGCPKKRRVLAPAPPEETVPDTGDAAARARFQDARARFGRDAATAPEAVNTFTEIAREYPQDPIAPYALLYAGIAALEAQSYDKAADTLTEVITADAAEPAIKARGRLFLGITYNYQGRHTEAVDLLQTGQGEVHSDAEKVEWLAAMAEALSRSGARTQSLRFYDDWYADADPAEQAYIMSRLDALTGELGVADARAAFDRLSRRDTPVAAVLGARVAADWAAEGEAERSRQVRALIEPARRRLGLDVAAGTGKGGSVRRLGTVLPLSGRRARAGDLALRGVTLAAGGFRDIAGVRGFEVSVRDTASESTGARAAVDALADEGVIAVIGPIDGDSVDAGAVRAHALGLPLISLNPRSGRRFGPELPQGSPYVFHILQSAEDRAEALARYALAQGVRTFAVLGPQSGYGRAVTRAFVDEIERGGGEIVTQATYDAQATSFGDSIKALRGSFQAVFVPDQATRLELIAPALAVADLYALPRSASKPKVGKKILLLSTAEFLAPRYLRSAGRYSEGAVLAPGFYPDRDDPVIGDFVARYQQAFGKLPTPLDAYAYDAARVVGEAVTAGADHRAAVGDLMAAGTTPGLTGTISFDDKRRRRDDGLLFTVVRDGDDYAIRAMRD